MEIHRAYSLLNIKSINDGDRVIEGVASTPTPDRMGDIVEPLGAKFALPMPLLLYHNSQMPVGEVEFAKPSKAGIPYRARIAAIDEPGNLKDRVDEAWQSVKAKLIRGVSIGFRALEYSFLEGGGVRFSEWEWMELSLVSIPANSEATITAVKSADLAARFAASGAKAVPPIVRLTSPGASGNQRRKGAVYLT